MSVENMKSPSQQGWKAVRHRSWWVVLSRVLELLPILVVIGGALVLVAKGVVNFICLWWY